VVWEAGTVDVAWRMIRIKGQGLVRAPSTKSGEDGEAALTLPSWGMDMLRRRWELAGRPPSGPIFRDSRKGWRDPVNVSRIIREVREGTDYEWLTSHGLGRKTVATLLDEGGATAREIADVLRHAKPSMTQDVYMARRSSTAKQAKILEEALKL
jgi:integrase